MKTTIINGRKYTITDGPNFQLPYKLTGNRGAEYILSRSSIHPEILQALPIDRLKCSVSSARSLGFLTDADGDLKEALI